MRRLAELGRRALVASIIGVLLSPAASLAGSAAPQPAGDFRAPPDSPEGSWAVGDVVAGLKGKGVWARTLRRFRLADDEGTVEVAAGCPKEDGSLSLSFKIELPAGREQALKWNRPVVESTETRRVVVAESWWETLTADVQVPNYGGPWVDVAVKAAGRARKATLRGSGNRGHLTARAAEWLTPGLATELPLADGRSVAVAIGADRPTYRELMGKCELVEAYRAAAASDRDPLPDAEPPHRSPDGFVFGGPWNRKIRRDVATVKELPTKLAKRIGWHGHNWENYQGELRVAADLARRCLELDPREAARAPLRQAEGKEVEDLDGLGEKLEVCQQPSHKFVNLSKLGGGEGLRQLWMLVKVPDEALWRNARKFEVQVGFYPVQGDQGVERDGEYLKRQALIDAYEIGTMVLYKK